MVSVLHIFPVHRIRISQTVDNGALNQKSLTHKMEPKLLTNAFLNSTSSVSDWCSILTIRFLLLTIPTFKSVRNVNNFLGLFGERSVAGVLDWLRKQKKKIWKICMFENVFVTLPRYQTNNEEVQEEECKFKKSAKWKLCRQTCIPEILQKENNEIVDEFTEWMWRRRRRRQQREPNGSHRTNV